MLDTPQFNCKVENRKFRTHSYISKKKRQFVYCDSEIHFNTLDIK